jgi:protein-S-isoprenylcysteine O-methyltransferase Ste14
VGGVKGRVFVGVQAVLLAALVLVPRWADTWALPGWTGVVGWVTAIAGAAVALAAFPQLGSALTPLPEPRSDAELTTGGLYRWVRHPIYSGVLAMGWGWTVAHPSWATVGVVVALTVLFNAKARYEEGLLGERYSDYAAYAASTPRFVPRPTARRPG